MEMSQRLPGDVSNKLQSAPLPQVMDNRAVPLEDTGWLEEWGKKINGKNAKLVWSGAYYEFQTVDRVLSAGNDGDFDENTPCALTSCTKVFTGMAVMRTMHLKPHDWYPDKFMHEFKGWEEWRDFVVLDNEDTDGRPGWSGRTAPGVTVHHLLTHTSGWPFGLRGDRNLIRRVPLYFEPGKSFGYSIGHRILGWMLLDYWKAQPEGQGFQNLSDVFRLLLDEPLNLTGTRFIKGVFSHPHSVMGEFFDMRFFDMPEVSDDDDPADLSMESTGADMMKVAMVALRHGQLPDGSWYVTRDEWAKWAATNQLPDGKLSSALAHWRMEDWGISFIWRTALTRTVNSGAFGWSYFGATYHDYQGDGNAGQAIAVGWKGFSSCGLRADYEQGIAFVAMQEIVPDPGCRNFGECIHQGKVGPYTLRDVGNRLAETAPEILEQMKQGAVKCGCCHEVMMRHDDPTCCISCAQNIIRCGLRWSLPAGVAVLDFHKAEAKAPRRSEPLSDHHNQQQSNKDSN